MATKRKLPAKASKKGRAKRFYIRMRFSVRMKDYGFSLHDRRSKGHENNPVFVKEGFESKTTASTGRKRLFTALGVPPEKYDVQEGWFNV